MSSPQLDNAISWLEAHIHYESWAARSTRSGPVELSLDRMQRFMAMLGDPQRQPPIIHVTGTNGKGSTGRMITRLLMSEGLRVGTYSSPHLTRYNERFRVDDDDIDDVTLAALLEEIAADEVRFGERLMPFEALTAAAYLWFSRLRLDAAVVEVGVLGRFDATNVGDGRVAVATNVGFDHTSGEGDWEMRVAQEKAGIVKRGADLVLGSMPPRLADVFEHEGPGRTWRLGTEITITSDRATTGGRCLDVSTPWQSLNQLEVPLHGAHQSQNAATAIAAASAFVRRPLDDRCARAAFARVRMPARLEIVATDPLVIIDGAHNPDAARALTNALADIPAGGARTLIVGLLAGRDPVTMLDAFGAAGFDRIIACTPPSARAQPAAQLAASATQLDTVEVFDDVAAAIEHAVAISNAADQIVVTGSIYLAAAARDHLIER